MPRFVLDRVEGGLAWREARGARTGPLVVLRLSMKKSLFPVHRVGEIEASRAAAIFFSLNFFFFFGRKVLSIFFKKTFLKKWIKKSLQSHLF